MQGPTLAHLARVAFGHLRVRILRPTDEGEPVTDHRRSGSSGSSPLQRLAENIEASKRAGLSMRDVLQRMADAHGIALEEAERRVEDIRRRLFPEAP